MKTCPIGSVSFHLRNIQGQKRAYFTLKTPPLDKTTILALRIFVLPVMGDIKSVEEITKFLCGKLTLFNKPSGKVLLQGNIQSLFSPSIATDSMRSAYLFSSSPYTYSISQNSPCQRNLIAKVSFTDYIRLPKDGKIGFSLEFRYKPKEDV